jgi:pyrroloquinoline-quinone synthase
MTLDPMTAEMDATPVADAVRRALVGRELLAHPFYRRWEAGELEPGELADYAVQYRAFEAALPAVLTAVARQLREAGDTDSAALIEKNLADEMGCPEPHLALFDRFAGAVEGGTGSAQPGPTAAALVTTYFDLVARGPEAALAGLAAYETQAAAIAASKAEGLRRWYGMDAAGTEFWDVHAGMDASHGAWATEALDRMGADPDLVTTSARRGADAWWALLDEREAARPGSAELCSHH